MTEFWGIPEKCHCGEPAVHDTCYDSERGWYGRGMCAECDLVRCDAYPGACKGQDLTQEQYND